MIWIVWFGGFLIRIFEADLPETLQASDTQIEQIRAMYHEKGMAEWELRKPYEMQLNIMDEDKFETLQVRDTCIKKINTCMKIYTASSIWYLVSLFFVLMCMVIGQQLWNTDLIS